MITLPFNFEVADAHADVEKTWGEIQLKPSSFVDFLTEVRFRLHPPADLSFPFGLSRSWDLTGPTGGPSSTTHRSPSKGRCTSFGNSSGTKPLVCPRLNLLLGLFVLLDCYPSSKRHDSLYRPARLNCCS